MDRTENKYWFNGKIIKKNQFKPAVYRSTVNIIMDPKISDGPGQQKQLNSTISSTHSRILSLERYQKEFDVVLSRLVRISSTLNPDKNPSNLENLALINKTKEEPVSDVSNRRPPGILGQVWDLGESAEHISIVLGQHLKNINDNLDHIENYL